MKKSILVFCFACSLTTLFGQALYLDYPSIYVKFSTGVSVPFSKALTGQFTDKLVQFDDRHSYNEYLTAGLFYGQHFGIELSYTGSKGSNSQAGKKTFNNVLEEMYGEKYYITSTNRGPSYESLIAGGFDRYSVSLMYRMKYEKFFLVSRLSLGVSSIPLHGRDIILKEKNSNHYLNLNIRPSNNSSSYFTFGPGISVGHRFLHRFVISLDCQYNWFRMDFDYEMKTRDMTSGTSDTETFPYTKNIHSMNFGIGLSYDIKYGKKLNPDHPSLPDLQKNY